MNRRTDFSLHRNWWVNYSIEGRTMLIHTGSLLWLIPLTWVPQVLGSKTCGFFLICMFPSLFNLDGFEFPPLLPFPQWVRIAKPLLIPPIKSVTAPLPIFRALAAANRTGYTAPDGSTNTYSYDTLNRLTTLANSATGSFGFSYDALSRRTQMTRPNGVTTNYTYDNLSRLLSVLHQLSRSTIDGATYTVDNAGNRTAKTDDYSSVTSDYTYDALYELTQVTQGGTTTESYSYDPAGNRTASLGIPSYTTNSSNEMTANSNASYTYDSNGNTHTKTDSTGTTTYAWDYENRLTTVTLPGSSGTVTFKYDPFGRRIEKISPTTTSIFAYDGANLVETTNGSGSEVASYTRTQNIDEPLAMDRSGTIDFYEQDGLGSITSLSNAAGALAQTYTYDSFGNTTNSSGSLTNFFRYTGREFDTETGLYYYRARYYDPVNGRFLSQDPENFTAGPNFYAYAFNSPTLLIDPMGYAGVPPGLSAPIQNGLIQQLKNIFPGSN